MNRRARLVAIALAVVATAFGISLVIVGMPWDVYAESATGSAFIGPEFRPISAGFIPLVGGTIVLTGVLLNRPLVAWAGWMLITAFAILFVFGAGGALVPVAILLLAMLRRNDWLAKRN